VSTRPTSASRGKVEPKPRHEIPQVTLSFSELQYLSVRYSDRLAANDIVASVGSRGDSYDALAGSLHGLYKWELIYPKGPWAGLGCAQLIWPQLGGLVLV
jgi:hypothetical protein